MMSSPVKPKLTAEEKFQLLLLEYEKAFQVKDGHITCSFCHHPLPLGFRENGQDKYVFVCKRCGVWQEHETWKYDPAERERRLRERIMLKGE